MGALDFPDCHVLITTSDELCCVEWVKLYLKDGQEAQVSKRYGSELLPLEHLNRESLVHANRNKLFAVVREGEL